MAFDGFLVVLVISLVVSGALHYWLKQYVTPGHWSFVSKVIIGWVGGWLGPMVFGDWGWMYRNVDVCTTFVGTFALLVVMIDLVNTCCKR